MSRTAGVVADEAGICCSTCISYALVFLTLTFALITCSVVATAAPVKAARLYPTLPTNIGRHRTLTGDDVSLYGEHQCASAGNVGVFLDTVIANSASNGATAASAADSADTNAVGEGEKATKASRKAGEKADTFNNFVRKNLKSGGTSKYLNRKPGKVSMAKQRWMNRSGGEGSGGNRFGSKYGRRNGGGNGNSNDNGDQAFSGAGGGGYNKPRGLQQWGLDSLEMSLDLIATQSDVQVSTEVEGDESAQATTAAAVATSVDTVPPLEGASHRPVTAAPNPSTTVPVPTSTNPATNRSTATAWPLSSTSKDPTTTAAAFKTTKSAKPTPAVPAAAKATAAPKDRVTAKMTARQREHERIQAMTALAPKCPGHSMASKLLVVKKSGANKVTLLSTLCLTLSFGVVV
jgi:hypothetical protein